MHAYRYLRFTYQAFNSTYIHLMGCLAGCFIQTMDIIIPRNKYKDCCRFPVKTFISHQLDKQNHLSVSCSAPSHPRWLQKKAMEFVFKKSPVFNPRTRVPNNTECWLLNLYTYLRVVNTCASKARESWHQDAHLA